MSLVTFGATSLRLTPPGRGRIADADRFTVTATGPESNAAVAATALGAEAGWLSKVADGPVGRRVESAVRQRGVDVDCLTGDSRQGIRFAERGSPPREDDTVADEIEPAIADVDPDRFPLERVREADAFYTTGATAAHSEDAARACASLLSESVGADDRTAFGLAFEESTVDPDRAEAIAEELFPAADTLIVRQRELEAVFDRSGSPREMAHAVSSIHEFDTVAVTRGERGAVVVDGSTVHEREALDGRVIDRAGSHDAFAGAFLARLADDGDPAGALAAGVAAATLCRTTPGPLLTTTPLEIEATVEEMDRERASR
jgi:2-dehydro-3-deoxygluconokinase